MTTVKKIKWLFIGLIFGGAIGSAIALLYAPESGKHLRKDISRKTNKLYDDSKQKTVDLWYGAKEKAESAIESANDVLNSSVEKIMRKKEKVKDALKSGFNE